MTGRSMGSHHSAASVTDVWLTPPPIIAALGGANSFDLDPCAAVDQPWPTARRHLTAEDDGLRQEWGGRVWLNPPYSNPAVGRFMARLAEHNRGTALIFARTETELFFRQVWGCASALLFLEGRLFFHVARDTSFPRTGKPPVFVPRGGRAPANGGAPSVLCAYGHSDAEILADAGIAGAFVSLLLPRFVAILAVDRTWGEIVADAVREAGGPVRLDALYRRVAGEAKARGRAHYRAKIRQVLQRGPFRRIERGVWAMEGR